MSQNTIFDRSQEIRNETEQFANTRGRVANVLDDINETKANKVDVDLAILGLREELDLFLGIITTLQEADVQHDLELEALRQKDIFQDGAINSLFNNDITLSNQISQEILDREAGDAALTTALGFKFDKPTALADGSYALVKSGAVFSWESTVSLGKNIFNNNLTLDADRSQNLNTKKLTFTNGRFSVPSLEMEITSANSVPNKIWTDGADLWLTNSSGLNNRLINFSTFNLSQITLISTSGSNILNTNTVDVNGISQANKNVVIDNAATVTYIDCLSSTPDKFQAIYTKLGSAAIVFRAGTGVTLISVDAEVSMVGIAGSTATLTKIGNTYFLRMSNA